LPLAYIKKLLLVDQNRAYAATLTALKTNREIRVVVRSMNYHFRRRLTGKWQKQD